MKKEECVAYEPEARIERLGEDRMCRVEDEF